MFFGLIIGQHSLQISAQNFENRGGAGNKLKMCSSLTEIFVSKYEGKYTLRVLPV